MVGRRKKPAFIFPDLAYRPEEISINSLRQISY